MHIYVDQRGSRDSKLPRKWLFWLFAAGFVFLGFQPPSTRAQSPPSTRWKVGDIWNFDVDVPGGKPYKTYVMLIGDPKVEGVPCWQLEWRPGDKAPADLKWYRLFVDQKTGAPVQALRWPGEEEIALETAGPMSFLTALPEGLPLEWFHGAELPNGKADIAGTKRRIEIRKEEKSDHYFLEMTLFDKDNAQWTVRQQWVAGEKWWHTHERRVKGARTLTATRMWAPPIKSLGQIDPAAEWNKFVKAHPLGRDVKLHPPVLLSGKTPTLAYLLARLKSATGLRFTVADNLAEHDPDLNDLSAKHENAYTFMEIVAQRDLDDGRWEKVEGGYRLEGARRIALPPPNRFPWVCTSVGLLLAVALAGGAFVIYRRRGTKSAVTPSKEVAHVKGQTANKEPT